VLRLKLARTITLIGSASLIGLACMDIEEDPSGSGVERQWTVATIPVEQVFEDEPMMHVARNLPTFGGFYFTDQDQIEVALTNVADLGKAIALIAPLLGSHEPTGGYVAKQVSHTFLELARYRTVLRGRVFRAGTDVISLGVKEWLAFGFSSSTRVS
jgi:hypothetical protein